jgi:secreted PhoX family phosphatase
MPHQLPPGTTRAQAYESSQNNGINPSPNALFEHVVAHRYGRRAVLQGLLAGSALAIIGGPDALANGAARHSFAFAEVSHGVDRTHHVAAGYKVDVLIRWGDPVTADAPPFDPRRQSAAAQQKQFGYNNDYVAYMPLPLGSNNPDRGLLVVNHEYTNEELMFPGLGRQDAKQVNFAGMTPDLVAIEMAAHGMSVVEIQKNPEGQWSVVSGSPYSRRLDALDTVFEITGPAAGHTRLKTRADASGRKVIGTLNNCAGGVTPWGTVLSGEENVHGYFWGKLDEANPEARNHKRFGVPDNWYAWGKYHDRFDVNKEPNEANRYGWVVEIDPYNPRSIPKKRTALGRVKHEGATPVVNRDGRVAVYCGDDERFEYVYKFVTTGRFNAANRNANIDLLDAGTLYVARYSADGTGEWLPLVQGQGPLIPANGFNSQADVLIETRRAADLLGATKMDRPEEIEVNPRNGKVYAIMTNNSRRKADEVDATNTRAGNEWGQIVEMIPADGDHAARRFTWSLLIQGGNPADAKVAGIYGPETSANGWFACPDNAAFDNQGRFWVGTDQGESWQKASGTADGIWAVETEGPNRGKSKMFYRNPVGAEICGPCFTPDDKSLFVSVQHPAADGAGAFTRNGKVSTFEDPGTRWPDFKEDMPPRPAVIVITKLDGGVLGG